MNKVIFGSACMISSMIGIFVGIPVLFGGSLSTNQGKILIGIFIMLAALWIFGFVLGIMNLKDEKDDLIDSVEKNINVEMGEINNEEQKQS